MTTQPTYSTADTWSTAAELYTGPIAAATAQATRTLICEMHEASPFSEKSRVLELGAGTGSFTADLTKFAPGIHILATDIAPSMLAKLQSRQLPNVETRIIDATQDENPDIDPHAFTHSFAAFMTQFTSGAEEVVRNMTRATRSGGVIGLATWVDPAINKPWEAACRRLDPTYVPISMFEEGAWGITEQGSSAQEDAERALTRAGCVDVHSHIIEVTMEFRDWQHFVEHWYTAKNPGMLRMQSAWKGEGGIEAVRDTLGKVVREQFDGGQLFLLKAACTVGKT